MPRNTWVEIGESIKSAVCNSCLCTIHPGTARVVVLTGLGGGAATRIHCMDCKGAALRILERQRDIAKAERALQMDNGALKIAELEAAMEFVDRAPGQCACGLQHSGEGCPDAEEATT